MFIHRISKGMQKKNVVPHHPRRLYATTISAMEKSVYILQWSYHSAK
ncbi:hypothetical protein SynA15127_01506 [Synechococcus sp. A15-127]|nr:hypothetical protein SynA15127_01506 [Synechococcus sp. A15-127]